MLKPTPHAMCSQPVPPLGHVPQHALSRLDDRHIAVRQEAVQLHHGGTQPGFCCSWFSLAALAIRRSRRGLRLSGIAIRQRACESMRIKCDGRGVQRAKERQQLPCSRCTSGSGTTPSEHQNSVERLMANESNCCLHTHTCTPASPARAAIWSSCSSLDSRTSCQMASTTCREQGCS